MKCCSKPMKPGTNNNDVGFICNSCAAFIKTNLSKYTECDLCRFYVKTTKLTKVYGAEPADTVLFCKTCMKKTWDAE